MLYFAYGSNIHQEQMKKRCSGCKYLKKHILQDYRLTFRSELCVADIEFKKGSRVQAGQGRKYARLSLGLARVLYIN